MSDMKDIAIAFEAKKVSVNQNKDGIILRMSIHPHECPERIWTDWVGTRYQVALVQIGDDEQATAPDATLEANQAIAAAGMLCRDEKFQQWLLNQEDKYPAGREVETIQDPDAEQWAVAQLRTALGIQSRTELRTNKAALERWQAIRKQFMEDML